MSLTPLWAASFTFKPTMGWASVVFEPHIRRQSVSSIWEKGVVAAPLPSVVARPATEGACQTRAQLSTLFVPRTALANFWNKKFSSLVHREDASTPILSLP